MRAQSAFREIHSVTLQTPAASDELDYHAPLILKACWHFVGPNTRGWQLAKPCRLRGQSRHFEFGVALTASPLMSGHVPP